MPLQVAEVSGELPTFALFAPLQPGTTKKYNLKGTGPIVGNLEGDPMRAVSGTSGAATMITAMPRRLATRTSAPVTSRTWVTPPGTPSTPEKPTSLDETVSRRLLRLERELEKLCRAVPAVRDLVQLRMCICQPYLKHFPPFSTFFFSFAISITPVRILT